MGIENRKKIDDLINQLLDFYTERKDKVISELSLCNTKDDVEYIYEYFYSKNLDEIKWLFEYLVRVNNQSSHELLKKFFVHEDEKIREKSYSYFDALIETRKEDIIIFLLNSSFETNVLFAIEKSAYISSSKFIRVFLDLIPKNFYNEKILLPALEIVGDINDKRIFALLSQIISLENIESKIKENAMQKLITHPVNAFKYISEFFTARDKNIKKIAYNAIMSLRGIEWEKHIIQNLKTETDVDLLCFMILRIKNIETKELFEQILDILVNSKEEILENAVINILNRIKNKNILDWLMAVEHSKLDKKNMLVVLELISKYADKKAFDLLKNLYSFLKDKYVKIKILQFVNNFHNLEVKNFLLQIFDLNNEFSYIAGIGLIGYVNVSNLAEIEIFYNSKQRYKKEIFLSIISTLNKDCFVGQANRNIVRKIFELVQNENTSIRFLAINCISKIDAPETLKILLKYSLDENPNIAEGAKSNLAKFILEYPDRIFDIFQELTLENCHLYKDVLVEIFTEYDFYLNFEILKKIIRGLEYKNQNHVLYGNVFLILSKVLNKNLNVFFDYLLTDEFNYVIVSKILENFDDSLFIDLDQKTILHLYNSFDFNVKKLFLKRFAKSDNLFDSFTTDLVNNNYISIDDKINIIKEYK